MQGQKQNKRGFLKRLNDYPEENIYLKLQQKHHPVMYGIR